MIVRLLFLAVCLAGVILSRRPTWVLRGAGLLAIAGLGAVADAVWAGPGPGWAAFWLVPVAVGALGWNSWLIASDPAPLFEESARALFLECERTASGYLVRAGGTATRIGYRRPSSRYGILTFPPASVSKKMALLKQLLYKKLPPLFPRLKIRI